MKGLTNDMVAGCIRDMKSKRGVLHASQRYIRMYMGPRLVYYTVCGLRSDRDKFDTTWTDETPTCEKCISIQEASHGN